MPSRVETAVQATRSNLGLASIPVLATLLAGSKLLRALHAGPGGGLTFPLPTGLPTLWTYVSIPNGPLGTGGGAVELVTVLPLFLIGIIISAALEAGFLGTIASRIRERDRSFIDNIEQFIIRILGVTVLRVALTVAMLPLLFVSPLLAIVVLVVVMYLIYGHAFVIIVEDAEFFDALSTSVEYALEDGGYAIYGGAHLLGGGIASVVLTSLVRNVGLPGILLATGIVAVPAVAVSTYGILLFQDLTTA